MQTEPSLPQNRCDETCTPVSPCGSKAEPGLAESPDSLLLTNSSLNILFKYYHFLCVLEHERGWETLV